MLNELESTQQSLRYQLALWRIPGIHPTLYYQLEKVFPELEELFRCDSRELQQAGIKEKYSAAIAAPDWTAIDDQLRWAEQAGHSIISIHMPSYPALLREIADPPPILFCHGDTTLLSSRQLAMVGTRNPSHNGAETAELFAAHLARAGITITSGLAQGIDAASHRGALQINGKTIAVMGTGIDQIYPTANRSLAQKIAEQGLIVTEFPHQTLPHAHNFPRRNRIISGLSMGVVVVEAALRSGSLITARTANEQGREVFAIPGSIHNPLAKGCHYLLRQGAKLVECAEDIMEELGALSEHVNHHEQQLSKKCQIPLDITQQMLVKCVDYEMTPVDLIIQRTDVNSTKVMSELVKMQLAGYIRAVPGGYVKV